MADSQLCYVNVGRCRWHRTGKYTQRTSDLPVRPNTHVPTHNHTHAQPHTAHAHTTAHVCTHTLSYTHMHVCVHTRTSLSSLDSSNFANSVTLFNTQDPRRGLRLLVPC